LITDSESCISLRSQSFLTRYLDFAFSEGEALRVLADLHGGGDRSNEEVVLEYEEIKQQVTLARFLIMKFNLYRFL
jgi:hypothetical protein